jgi:hypothetical protein
LVRERTFGGYGADTDIIVASAKAYLAALNKLLFAGGRRRAVHVNLGEQSPALRPERTKP